MTRILTAISICGVFVLSALALEHGQLPASRGAAPVDPTLAIEIVEHACGIECDWALSNSFAFGGSDAAVIVGLA